ncbi:MAG: hypothetical protein ACHQ3P_07210 [Candidatus Limnocylindrales bacterium]
MDQNIPNEAGIHEADPVITMDLGLDTSASHPSAVPSVSHPSVVPSFLAELTRAMQAAAEQMRAHIDADVADDAAEEIERAHARGAIEADELRRLADEDIGGIDAWLTAETERVRGEAARRTDERRTELASHLAKHDSIIAAEVDGVEAAVVEYRSTLDTFFAELKEADDPAELARRAGSLPAPPDLESARGAARADAVARFANAGSDADGTAEPTEMAPSVEVAALERVEAARPEQVEAAALEPVEAEAPEPAETTMPEPAVAATTADPPSDEGVGLGVMDPADEAGEEGDVEVEVEAPPPAPEPVAAGSIPTSTAAARLFRTITDWAAQPSGNGEHRSDQDS